MALDFLGLQSCAQTRPAGECVPWALAFAGREETAQRPAWPQRPGLEHPLCASSPCRLRRPSGIEGEGDGIPLGSGRLASSAARSVHSGGWESPYPTRSRPPSGCAACRAAATGSMSGMLTPASSTTASCRADQCWNEGGGAFSAADLPTRPYAPSWAGAATAAEEGARGQCRKQCRRLLLI